MTKLFTIEDRSPRRPFLPNESKNDPCKTWSGRCADSTGGGNAITSTGRDAAWNVGLLATVAHIATAALYSAAIDLLDFRLGYRVATGVDSGSLYRRRTFLP